MEAVFETPLKTLDVAAALFAPLQKKLDDLRENGLYRTFYEFSHISEHPGHTAHGGRVVQVWSGNDYFGLGQHPDLIKAQIESTQLHGTSSGGSRNIGGTSVSHAELEKRIAAWHGKDRALVFSSGYAANFETLSTLIAAIPDMVVFSDRNNHRSLIEGIARTGCTKHVFPHNDFEALDRMLAGYDRERPKLIVFESVYSMDGDVAPLGAFFDLAEKHGALTFLDETHAIGLMGPTGAGLAEELNDHRATFVQGVFSKALGTLGGYVAGPDSAIDYVRSHAPGFIFSSTMPQAVLDATLTGLDIVQRGDDLRRGVMDNVIRLKNALRNAGLRFLDGGTHIVPVIVPGGERVHRVSRRLLDEFGIYVAPVTYPSVPKGTERFRVTIAPFRTPEQIEAFVSKLQLCLEQD